MKLDLRMPIAFNIQAKCTDISKDIWEMEYTEKFKTEDKAAFELSGKMMDGLLSDTFKIDVLDNSITIRVIGPRTKIFSMLAAKFLANSAFGQMQLQELLAYASIGMMGEKHLSKIKPTYHRTSSKKTRSKGISRREGEDEH